MTLKIRRYYLPESSRPWPARLARRLTGRAVPSFPRTIQVETQTGCNADCVFCDYGTSSVGQPSGRMEPELFRRIVDECAAGGLRRFSPYLTNEPLADDRLPDLLAYAGRALRRAKIVVTTNGHFLTPAMTDRLLALDPPLHAIHVSFQGVDRAFYESSMRGNLRFERTLSHLEALAGRLRRDRRDRPRLVVTMVATRGLDAGRAVAFWAERGIAAKVTALDNRGGKVEADRLALLPRLSPYRNCPRLMKQMYVHFNGDVVLCCVDNSRTVVLGNAARQSLREIWNSPGAVEHRRRYIAGEFEGLALCGTCTIDR